MKNTDSSYPSPFFSYLLEAPHAVPHAAGFSSVLSEAPHAVPHAAEVSGSSFFIHPKIFDNAIVFTSYHLFLFCLLARIL